MNLPHPYEKQNKVYAYKNKDGTFDLFGKTYNLKEKIKSVGGSWNGATWRISEESVLELKPLLMIKVRLDKHCHEEEGLHYATHKEVACGYMKVGCSHCDTSAICGKDVKILEVLDKNIEELAKKYDGNIGQTGKV